MIVVFVDGSNRLGGAWYLSSPTVGDYETYITKELVSEVDSKYRTLPSRDSRGITGCSMGGDGAAHLALTYPDVFSVAVPISGTYDWEADPSWEVAKTYWTVQPQSWEDWPKMDGWSQAYLAFAAAAAANPDNPPFYLDMPFEIKNGKAQIVPDVFERVNALDPTHDLLDYLNQPVRLQGLMLYHGDADSTVPVETARGFDKSLTESGVPHEYVEVKGGEHCTLDWAPVLMFMSQHLAH
jgi:S-formylglutathione hydrolase FrmB